MADRHPARSRAQIDDAVRELQSRAHLVDDRLAGALTVVELLAAVVLALFVAFFLLKDGRAMATWMLAQLRGLLVFVGSAVPYIGATVTGTVAVLVALAVNGPVDASLALVAVIAVQQLDGNLLEPLIVGPAGAPAPRGGGDRRVRRLLSGAR